MSSHQLWPWLLAVYRGWLNYPAISGWDYTGPYIGMRFHRYETILLSYIPFLPYNIMEVKNGCISNRIATFQIQANFQLNHDYGRKSRGWNFLTQQFCFRGWFPANEVIKGCPGICSPIRMNYQKWWKCQGMTWKSLLKVDPVTRILLESDLSSDLLTLVICRGCLDAILPSSIEFISHSRLPESKWLRTMVSKSPK